MNVPALALPPLVDTFTSPVVAVAGTVNTSCVVLALVMAAGTPLTVMVLLIAVALNPVPTIVTLDPMFPLEGDMLEIVTVLPPLVVGVNTITGFSCVLSLVDEDVPLMTKSIVSPAATACVSGADAGDLNAPLRGDPLRRSQEPPEPDQLRRPP